MTVTTSELDEILKIGMWYRGFGLNQFFECMLIETEHAKAEE